MSSQTSTDTSVAIGIDIGQKRDPTAICVAESTQRTGPGQTPKHYAVRYLQRLPLGTPYPHVARRLAEICQRASCRREAPEIFVDATGVGTPIVDMLRTALPAGQHLWAVFFVHGDHRRVHAQQHKITLGKAFLAKRLQALLNHRRIHLPQTPEALALARELQNYEIRVDDKGTDRYGAFRHGTHDDLATALGLAVQGDIDRSHTLP